MATRLNKIEFINRCRIKYGDKFDYSDVIYINSNSRVIINCNKHGFFEITPWKHYDSKYGCRKCAFDLKKSNKKTTEEFILESKNIHGNLYDYSKSKYSGADDDIEIICKRHGSFWQRPANHLTGNKCPKCRNLHTTEEFIFNVSKKHGDIYDYSLVDYTHNRNKVKIICKTHGIFEQKAGIHMDGKGCPTCSSSKGELNIKKWLMDNNIKYESQKTFEDCVNPKTNYHLKYDFYLPDFNTLIEYDGKQHYVYIKEWTGDTKSEFENRQLKDKIKTRYAKNKKIKLIRIKYTIKSIDKILRKKLKEI